MSHRTHPIEENAELLVDQLLRLLRSKMQEKGMSQLSVQESLGWGRTYISQLFRKQKALRVDQVLMILDTLGVEPQEFFAEMFGAPTLPRFHAPTVRDRDRLIQIMATAYQTRNNAELRQGTPTTDRGGIGEEGISREEFSATIRALVLFAATLGKAPVEHFIVMYRLELQREGLLQEEGPETDDAPPVLDSPVH